MQAAAQLYGNKDETEALTISTVTHRVASRQLVHTRDARLGSVW